jgi:hypothetical protein
MLRSAVSDLGLEPHIWFCSAHFDVATCFLSFPELAMVFFRVAVEAREEEMPRTCSSVCLTHSNHDNDKVE